MVPSRIEYDTPIGDFLNVKVKLNSSNFLSGFALAG